MLLIIYSLRNSKCIRFKRFQNSNYSSADFFSLYFINKRCWVDPFSYSKSFQIIPKMPVVRNQSIVCFYVLETYQYVSMLNTISLADTTNLPKVFHIKFVYHFQVAIFTIDIHPSGRNILCYTSVFRKLPLAASFYANPDHLGHLS